jgi:hypothetical protein
MIPAISALGPAFLAVFAVSELPKIIQGLKEAIYWMEDFGKEAQAAFAEAVKASDEAYTHFKDIKTGISLRNEVNRNIAALTVQRDVLDNTGGSMLNYARGVAALFSGNIAASATYLGLAHQQQLTTEQLAHLEKQRLEQLNRETELEKQAHPHREKAAHEYTDALTAQLQAVREEIQLLQSGELPAYERINLETQRRIDAATREIAKDRELYNQKKIGLTELENREREYTKLVAELADERELKLHQEFEKEQAELFEKMGKLKFAIPALPKDFFTPLTEGVTQLTAAQRAALPTLEEIKRVEQDLARLWPTLTEEERKAMSEQLIHNAAIRQATTLTGNHKETVQQLTLAITQELVADGKWTQEQAKAILAAQGLDAETIREINLQKQLTQQLKEGAHVQAEWTAAKKAGMEIEQSWTQAVDQEKDAISQNMAAAIEGIALQTAALIGGRKLEAEVEGGIDVAKSVEYMAQFIGSWGTDAAALLASVKYGLAAAEYFKVAGSGSASGAGGGGASAPGRVGGSPGPTAPAAMGSRVPMTPDITSLGGGGGGGGPTINVHVYGPADEAQHIAGVLNNFTQRRGGQLVSSRSISPPKAGR